MVEQLPAAQQRPHDAAGDVDCRPRRERRSQQQRGRAGRGCERVVAAQKLPRKAENAGVELRLRADDVFRS